MPSQQIDPAKPRGTLKEWFAYIALRCIVCAIQSISLENCDRICHILAWFLSDWTRLRRQITDENLDRVYGSLSEEQKSLLRRKMWHHLLLMVCEVAHTGRKIHRTNWRDHFFIRDKETVYKIMMDPRPTVLVTGHFGNFEVAGHTVGILGSATTTIARPLDNPYIDSYLSEFRKLGGQHMLPKEGSAVAVQELLESGGTLGLLADQHAGGKGTWVEFFGHSTSCHKALALFVLSSKAPMFVHYNRRLDRPLRFEMGITGLADPALLNSSEVPQYLQSVHDLTEWYNARLEEAIRMSPEQYWWLHRRWREVPPNAQKRIEARKEQKRLQRSAA